MTPDTALLPPLPLLLAFMGASLVLAITPGPAVVYILARTLSQGRRSGLASVAGVALGNFGNAVGAALGLAAVLAVSSAAFTLIKLAGAAYLIWLGLKMWRAPEAAADMAELPSVARSPLRQVFRDGFVVALLNPKTALFFAAFLPQFMTPGLAAPIGQSVMLGAVFVLIATGTDSLYVLLAGLLAPRLQQARGAARWGRRAAGSAFIGLGLLTAFSARPGR
jgi:threonine/homoserine/homoserine lactone efflux protein